MIPLTPEKIVVLTKKAALLRASLIRALIQAKSGHTAGPLDMADIFAYLFFHALRHDPKNPDWPERDRIVLSNGHICPILYAAMTHAGYGSVKEFEEKLRTFGSPFQGHPHRDFLPALETSSGPLGSGLSQAVGMALADRIDRGRSSPVQIYCLTGDGELDCGQIWEAAMLAGKERLQNLTVIVDRNNIQIDGYTEDVMPLEPLANKWRSFGFHVTEVDGHNFSDIDRAIGEAHAVFDKPSVILAQTIASKGIPAFERKFEWHGKPPGTPEEIEIAMRAVAEWEQLQEK